MINQNTISFIGTKDSHKEKLVLNLNYISEVKQSYFKEEVNSICISMSNGNMYLIGRIGNHTFDSFYYILDNNVFEKLLNLLN